MITTDDLKNLCINTGRKLVKLQVEDEKIEPHLNLTSKLIYPKYGKLSSNDRKKRISEQEARLLFVQCLEEYFKEIFYSIETPTNYRYDFTDKKKVYKEKIPKKPKGHEGQSALSDLSLFIRNADIINQNVNIEFKSHNPDEESITKDILKLIAEPYHGAFFHVLTDIGDKSLLYNNKHKDDQNYEGSNILNLPQKGVIDKIMQGFYLHYNQQRGNWSDLASGENKIILIAIVIDEFDLLAMKLFNKVSFDQSKLLDLFNFGYKTITSRTEAKELEIKNAEINDWELINLRDGETLYKFV